MSSRGPEFIGNLGSRFGAPRIQLPGRVKLLLVLLGMILIGAIAAYATFLEYIRPYEFGILEVKVALGESNRGIQKDVYPPGLAFVMPFGFQKMHHFPRVMQVLELTMDKTTSVRESADVFHDPAAKIQTSDGFWVQVDATILYRIVDPYLVLTSLGPGDMYLHQGLRPKAEPILKETLGQLTTEEFYNSPMRIAKAELAQQKLNEEMMTKGIQIEHVLIRYFQYNERIQQNIEEKKLQDQLVFTNHSKRKAADEEQNLNRTMARGEMEVQVTLEEGKAYGVEKKAETELYTRKKMAEADLLVQLAEAKRAELRNAAMQAVGSERMVALEMAKVLEGLDYILVPAAGAESLNPLDLDGVLKTFGVTALDVEGEPSPAIILPDPVIPPIEPLPAPEPIPLPEPVALPPDTLSAPGEAAQEVSSAPAEGEEVTQ